MIGNIENITTLGELKKSGYRPIGVKEEIRKNLILALQNNYNPFEQIIGYDDTVIPDIHTAILSRHNIVLLGLRGQAKTKIARLMTNLLDQLIPIIKGSDLNDNPFSPLSKYGKELISELGNDTPISWLNREERYTEKLATPDVTVADLIGDIDPIKAASLKLPYSDERVIHFGLIPRSNRGIFVINELPDLQARIQVALFNILQEKDAQIRGFKIRLPLDIFFIFTANPEDYTNRGSIVTPLKDRIDSQILTHYPKSITISRRITEQEARNLPEQYEKVRVSELLKDLIEQIAFEARSSDFVDPKSGVSARLTISSYENLISFAERRVLLNHESSTIARISDLTGVIPSVTGKIELVYEGEQEGSIKVTNILIGKAIKSLFINYFPNPDTRKLKTSNQTYFPITAWFSKGNKLDLFNTCTDKEYESKLTSVPGLKDLVRTQIKNIDKKEELLFMEFVLFGLSEFSILSKLPISSGTEFKDMMSTMLNPIGNFQNEDDELV